MWLAACSAKVWEASTSKVSTTLLESTFAVAAVPGLLPLPSSEDCVEPSPGEEAELLAEPSASDTAALGDAFTVAALSGLLPRPSSSPSPAAEAAEQLAVAAKLLTSVAPSLEAVAAKLLTSDSDAATGLLAAADLLAELSGSGSETASDGDAFSETGASTEEFALGEGLAASSSLEDIAAGPRETSHRRQAFEPKKRLRKRMRRRMTPRMRKRSRRMRKRSRRRMRRMRMRMRKRRMRMSVLSSEEVGEKEDEDEEETSDDEEDDNCRQGECHCVIFMRQLFLRETSDKNLFQI